MNRHIARAATLASGVIALGLAIPSAAYAADYEAARPAASVSCTGGLSVSTSGSSVTVTGTVTCTGLTPLSLSTTVTATGVTSTVTNLLSALPNVPLPINLTIPATNVTAACSALAAVTTGVTIAGSCSA
jgi:hypothetical protein